MSVSSDMSVDREVIGACPLDCPDTCNWVVTVRNGEATAQRGGYSIISSRIFCFFNVPSQTLLHPGLAATGYVTFPGQRRFDFNKL